MTDWTFTIEGAVAELAFAHPPHHVLDHAGVEQLELALADAAERGVRVTILTGASADVFVAHADLDDLVNITAGRATSGDPAAWPRVLRMLDRGPFVTIAAINGRAWGGGLEIALSCGLRIAGESASFCFPEVAIGILPAVAAHRLLATVPEHIALELMLLAEPFDAAEAHRLGLLNRVVPDEQLLPTARAMAARIIAFPSAAVAAIRSLVVDARDADERARRRRQQELFGELIATPGTGELVAAATARYAAGATAPIAFGLTDRTSR